MVVGELAALAWLAAFGLAVGALAGHGCRVMHLLVGHRDDAQPRRLEGLERCGVRFGVARVGSEAGMMLRAETS